MEFQSSLPRGERPAVPDDYPQYCVFQSSLPRGERLVEIEFVPVHLEFQSSLPRGERQTLRSISHSDTGFQSSLPRGERPKGVLFYGKVPISILAPTRGATGGMALTGCFLEISILAPTRGATRPDLKRLSKILFQSSLPRGERLRQSVFWDDEKEFQSSLPRGERHRLIGA